MYLYAIELYQLQFSILILALDISITYCKFFLLVGFLSVPIPLTCIILHCATCTDETQLVRDTEQYRQAAKLTAWLALFSGEFVLLFSEASDLCSQWALTPNCSGARSSPTRWRPGWPWTYHKAALETAPGPQGILTLCLGPKGGFEDSFQFEWLGEDSHRGLHLGDVTLIVCRCYPELWPAISLCLQNTVWEQFPQIYLRARSLL